MFQKALLIYGNLVEFVQVDKEKSSHKKLISTTPLNDALNALILALNASAAAFVLLFTCQIMGQQKKPCSIRLF